MSRINILDKSIYNLIAAGEVVEKPASVVKELVENSIDAHAKNISIEIVNGGIDRIRVSDDGCGMDEEDLSVAFLAHATSKISSKDDLANIGTLGFRGEALASIGAVSKTTMQSKEKSSISGYKIVVDGGELSPITPVGSTDGTIITVEKLFYNIPARSKFLRKPRTEETEITSLVARLILSNPNVSIRYSADNKLIYHSNGNNLLDAIYTIYGNSVIDNLIEINEIKDDISILGYIGKPTFSKPNRTYQTLIVNGRYVINMAISGAIAKAFENFLMKGNFPFFVISIRIPLDKVDVNVHPNKLEIKFEDSNKMYGYIYSLISEKLYNTLNIKSLPSQEEDKIDVNVDSNKLNILSNNDGVSFSDTNKTQTNNSQVTINEVTIDTTKTPEYKSVSDFITNHNTSDFKLQDNVLAQKLAARLISEKEELNQTHLSLALDDYKIVGILFNTFIVVEQNDYIYMIDQHAAHERLLYDKFKEQFNLQKIAVQPLIVPYILDLNYEEYAFVTDNIFSLNALGFELEPFGSNSYKVNCIPLLLKDLNIQTFFDDVLHNLTNKLILNKADAMQEYLAKSACRSAVKANDILSELEIKVLLTMLSKENQVLLCPHGRPIIIKITKTDIEKWFKRIV